MKRTDLYSKEQTAEIERISKLPTAKDRRTDLTTFCSANGKNYTAVYAKMNGMINATKGKTVPKKPYVKKETKPEGINPMLSISASSRSIDIPYSHLLIENGVLRIFMK